MYYYGQEDGSWQILSASDAETLTLGTNVSVDVPAARSLAIRTFELNAGDQISFTEDAESGSGNFYWLFDAAGQTVFEGASGQMAVHTANIEKAGRYTLMVSNRRYSQTAPDNGDGHLAFRLDRTPATSVAEVPVVKKTLGTLANEPLAVSLVMTAPEQYTSISFEIAQSGLWKLSLPALAEGVTGSWTLDAENSRYSRRPAYDDTAVDPSSGIGFGTVADDQLMFLPAGHYQLNVSVNAATAQTLALALSPLQLAPELVSGDVLETAELSQGQSAWYRLAVQEDDGLALLAGADGFSTKVFDALGYEIGQSALADGWSHAAGQLPAGYVYVQLRREEAGSAVAQLSMTRTDAGAALNVAPRIALDTEVSRAVPVVRAGFDLAEDGWVMLDTLAGNYSRLRISGPRGFEFDGSPREASNWGARVLWLPAGQYTAEYSQGSGDVIVLVRSPAQAQALVLGVPVSVDMAANDALQLFALDLDGSQDAWVHGLSGATAGNTYRLYDRQGNLVATGDPAKTAFTRLNVPHDGQYLLVIGRGPSSGNSAAIRFEMLQTPKNRQPLQFGEEVTSAFTLGYYQNGYSYQSYEYAFELTEATPFVLQQISSNGAGSLGYELRRRDGSNVSLQSNTGSVRNWGVLTPGSYYLRASNNSTGNLTNPHHFSFKVLAPVVADAALDAPMSFDLTQPLGLQQFRVELEAGQSYWLGVPDGIPYYEYFDVKAISPSGNVISAGIYGGYLGGARGLLIIAKESGSYLFSIPSKYVYSGVPVGSLTLSLQKGVVLTQDYSFGDIVQSSLTWPGELASYRFSLDEARQVWLNVAGDQYQATLRRIDGTGSVVLDRDISGSDIRQLLSLQAGDYELQLRPRTHLLSGYGSYHLQIQGVDALPVLAMDTPTVVEASQGRAAQALRFDGVAGSSILIDPRLASGSPSQYFYWELYGPSGSLVNSYSWWGSGNTDYAKKVSLTETGDYVLQLYGSEYAMAARSASVLVRSVSVSETPLELGSLISGRISVSGDVANYTLSLDSDRTILIDPQSGDVTVRVLNASMGEVLNFNAGSSAEYLSRRLPAGTYTFEVSASRATTPDYAFRVRDMVAFALDLGAVSQLSGDLPAGRNLVVQSFEVIAGQRYNLDFTTPTSSSALRYTLVDAFGREIVGQQAVSSASVSFTAAQTGKVYLLAKQNAASSGPVHFEATIRQPVGVAQELGWGGIVSGALTTREDQSIYRFQMAEAGWLDLQQLGVSQTAATIDIVAPDGTSVRSWSSLPVANGSRSVYLGAGDYSLRIRSNFDGAPVSFSFKAQQVPAAQILTRQPEVAQTLAQESSEETLSLWALQAHAGDVLNLNRTAWSGAGSVQILKPDGSVLATWSPATQAALTLNLTAGGSYLLRVQRDSLTNLDSNAFEFSATWGVVTPASTVTSSFSWSGTIAANTTQSFQFELTEPGLWYLDRVSYDWSSYYFGSVSLQSVDGRELSAGFDRPIALSAGVYTVKLSQLSSTTATVSLAIKRLGDASITSLLDFGQSVVLAAASHYGARVYQFSANSGELIQLNQLGSQAGSTWPSWTIYNRFGQIIASASRSSSDSSAISLASSGDYYLVFDAVGESPNGNAYTSGASFQLDRVDSTTPVAINLNDNVTVALDAVTQSRSYTLDISEAKQVMVDRLNSTSGDGMTWRLTGPYGFNQTLSEASVLTLQPGQYVLQVSTTGFNASSEGMRLLDLSAATPIQSGVVVEGRVQPAGDMLAYSVEAEAGDRIFVDFRDLLASGYSTNLRIIDPHRRALSINRNGMHNLGSEGVALVSGRYTILMDELNASDVPLPFRMAVYVNKPGQPRVIDLTALSRSMDLVVSDVSVASAEADGVIRSGSSIDVSWTTRNQGVTSTLGDFVERVVVRRASTNEVIAQAELPYREGAAGNGPLLNGQFVNRSARLVLPEGPFGAGELIVTVETDASNTQAEVGNDEENNRSIVSVSSALKDYANLSVENIALNPAANWQAGDQVTVSWDTVNTGAATTTGNWVERVEVVNLTTGVTVADLNIAAQGLDLGLGGVAARSASFTWPGGVNATGKFRLRVTVDSRSQIPEFNAAGSLEADNTRTTEVIAGPDLEVRNARVVSTDVLSGSTVLVQWEDVNTGSVAAPRSWQDRVVVRKRNADGSLGETIVDTYLSFPEDFDRPLAAGNSRARSFNFKLPDGIRGTGDFDISIKVESGSYYYSSGVIFEIRASGDAEANNQVSTSVHADAKPYPDLVVSGLVIPASIESGVPFDVSWTVSNIGPVAASGSWTDRVVLSSDAVYGNSDDIVLGNLTRRDPLGNGDSYTATLSVRTPTRIEGNYRIIVVTDANKSLIEPDTLADNQVISAAVPVTSTYVDLQPALSVVPAEIHAGETAHIEWQVTNRGTVASDATSWVDQVWLSTTPALGSDAILLGSVTRVGGVDKNGSYAAMLDAVIPRHLVGNYYFIVKTDVHSANYETDHRDNNTAAASQATLVRAEPKPDLRVSAINAPTLIKVGDTLELSYSIENAGDKAINSSWIYDAVRLVSATDPSVVLLSQTPGAIRTLAPGASYSGTARFKIGDAATTDWLIQVSADVWNYVSNERDESNNVATRALSIVHPDVVVGEIQTSGLLQGGEAISLSWTTRNIGSSAAADVTDEIYLSRDGKLQGALKLGSFVHSQIAAGDASNATLSVLLPIDTQGSYQLLVLTDTRKLLAETSAGEANNQSTQAISVAQDFYADLRVDNVSAPAQTIDDPATIEVEWTVSNQGTGPGRTDAWTDVVIFSRDEVLGNSDDMVIASVTHTGGLAAGDTYTGRASYRFGPAFSARGHVFVKTDSKSEVWENGAEANNVGKALHTVDVMPKPYADLTVSSVTTSGDAASGKPLTVSWTVKNEGIGVTDVASWSDTVWLSSNPDGSGVVAHFASANHLGQLGKGESYSRSVQVTLPEGLSGTYYLNVRTNSGNAAYEFVYGTNNQASSLGVPVTLSESPDLVVQGVSLPTAAQEGALIDVTWSVRNEGDVPAGGTWVDRVLLIPASGVGASVVLGNFTYDRGLASGIQYTRTEQVRLPSKIQGLYRVKVITNVNLGVGGAQVYEHGSARSNNELLSPETAQISLNNRPDLRVSGFEVPDHVTAGGSASIKYTVTNMGAEAATGRWKDSVYLSLDGTLSADDVLVGRFDNGAALAQTESYSSISASIDIPIRYRGSAYLIVVADGNYNVDEYPNENNNVRAARITVDPVPFADLVTSNVVAPTQAVHGASIEVSYKVSNLGSATTRGESATLDSWTDTVWLARDKRRPGAYKGDILLGSVTHKGKLEVGQDYLGQASVQIPEGMLSGEYFLTVWSDSYNVILEDTLANNINTDDPSDIDNNNYKARAISIIGVTLPDLVVAELSAVATADAGGAYSFSYTVKNRGDNVSATWYDNAYLTDDPDLTKAKEVFWLGSFKQERSLAYGDSYSVAQTVQLSPAAKGRYLVIRTDGGNGGRSYNANGRMDVAEVNEANNALAFASLVTPHAADLQVTRIETQPENFSGEETTISWTVTNLGDDVWSGTRGWVDSVYFSPDPEFIPQRATALGALVHPNTNGLASGESYTASLKVRLPAGTDGPYYIYVITDSAHTPQNLTDSPDHRAQDEKLAGFVGDANARDEHYATSAYEGALNNNNRSQAVLNITYREPDLVVDSIVLSDPAPRSGQIITVSWTVTNQGERATRTNSWFDGIYLSRDASLDLSDYPLVDRGGLVELQNKVRLSYLTADGKPRYLQPGESYTNSASFRLPESIEGDFKLIVKADTEMVRSHLPEVKSSIRDDLAVLEVQRPQGGQVGEFKDEGNNVRTIDLPITLATPPDLQVSTVTAPEHAMAGQKMLVNYTVINSGGATPSDQGQWYDMVYLSRDRFLDVNQDRYLGYVQHNGGLAAGGSYDASFNVTLPRILTARITCLSSPIRAASGLPGSLAACANSARNSTTRQPQSSRY